jgi:hypothetical protein
MKRLNILLLICSVFLLACGAGKNREDGQQKTTEELLRRVRTQKWSPLSGANRFALGLYNSVYRAANTGYDIGDVEKILKKGTDPNKSYGEAGWMDTNPLIIVARSSYTSCYNLEKGEKLPDVTPDVQTLLQLVSAGANIQAFPYVWIVVYIHDNGDIEQIKRQWKSDHEHEGATEEQLDARIKNTVADSNRLLEAFINAGADPAMRGDPYPFGQDAIRTMSDELAIEYFKKGTLPINEAIVKGSTWESQVDFLLKCTKLDKDSLDAARRSNDPKMIAKITKLWAEQNRNFAR